jgi:hypothetical protein
MDEAITRNQLFTGERDRNDRGAMPHPSERREHHASIVAYLYLAGS